MERDAWATSKAVDAGAMAPEAIDDAVTSLEARLGDSADIALAEARYRFIEALAKKTLKRPAAKATRSDKADRIILNRILGIPIFLVAMYLLFWFTIVLGGAFIDFFDVVGATVFVDGFGRLLDGIGSPAWLTTILASGIGAGSQTVLTFIPVVFAMFLGLTLLEDSGYMARAAFVMDRFMRWVGLPGKSFVPMLVGFGCNVPAIMATRTLENKRDRYMTIFMNPFMSCGARLPVYALFAAAFFGAAAGAMTFSLYIVGIVVAILTGLLLKATLFKALRERHAVLVAAHADLHDQGQIHRAHRGRPRDSQLGGNRRHLRQPGLSQLGSLQHRQDNHPGLRTHGRGRGQLAGNGGHLHRHLREGSGRRHPQLPL
jgi:ferrous iron transport protein B